MDVVLSSKVSINAERELTRPCTIASNSLSLRITESQSVTSIHRSDKMFMAWLANPRVSGKGGINHKDGVVLVRGHWARRDTRRFKA